ncbi:Protochlorophyllide-dependent translocon component 52, chloroplastic [Linum perenne]
METLTTTSLIPSSLFLHPQYLSKPSLSPKHNLILRTTPSKFKLLSSSSLSVDHTHALEEINDNNDSSKFDWYAQWYPVMPQCDLDKRVPHGKKVMGMDVVVWWDKKQNAWKVFDDMCPHRLAPLSEGRIDGSGRLQCVYHGWCFDGFGSCKLIPQAPVDGSPVHNNKRACVAAYPTVVQHGIVWFWPNSDPRYEVLIENLMDPAHVPYAHYGLLLTQPPKGIDGYEAKVDYGHSRFAAPCVFSIHGHNMAFGANKQCSRTAFVFLCIPVSPGHSRLIWASPRNFKLWVTKVVPRWMDHLGQNLVFDSDLRLLRLEEMKIKELGGNMNWHNACFVPTKSDALVVGFIRWLTKYSNGEVDFRGKYTTDAPTDPPREQLMDRYWTHVVNCNSCNGAYKSFKALETILLVLSVGLISIVAATKDGMMMLASSRTRIAIMATMCFVASMWLDRLVYTNFHYHDYHHTFRPISPFSIVRKVIGNTV